MIIKIISTIALSTILLTSAGIAEDTSKRREQGRLAAPGLESVVSNQEKTAEEIAKELANPATPLSTIGNHIEYRSFKGDLTDADSQGSWVYTFSAFLPVLGR